MNDIQTKFCKQFLGELPVSVGNNHFICAGFEFIETGTDVIRNTIGGIKKDGKYWAVFQEYHTPSMNHMEPDDYDSFEITYPDNTTPKSLNEALIAAFLCTKEQEVNNWFESETLAKITEEIEKDLKDFS